MKAKRNKNSREKVSYSKPQKGRMITAGAALRRARNALGKSILQISRETNISPEKIKALEEDIYDGFDSDTHTTGFIKIYAHYLGLDPQKIIALYRRTTSCKKDSTNKNIKKGEKNLEDISRRSEERNVVQYLIILIPILLVTILLAYFYVQYQNYQNPPQLEIFEPQNKETVQEDNITVKGKTENNTIVKINNESVSIEEDYTFKKDIELKSDTNVITIKAISTRNPTQETVEIITINREKGETEEKKEEEEEEEEKEEIEITIEVENSPTWTEIIKDDQLIKSEILDIGYKETLTPEKNVTISSSLPQNISIKTDDESIPFKRDENTISCEIKDYELLCD